MISSAHYLPKRDDLMIQSEQYDYKSPPNRDFNIEFDWKFIFQ